MHVIGDIDGRNCVIMDDMIDTAGTLVGGRGAEGSRRQTRLRLLHARGVLRSGDRAHQGSQARRGRQSPTPFRSAKGPACKNIRQLSVAFLFAETIRRISDGESVLAVRGAEQQFLRTEEPWSRALRCSSHWSHK